MYFIVPCPGCSSELRVPLDRGRLHVRCPVCDEEFYFDPDDPQSFQSGSFDLKHQKESPVSLNWQQSMRDWFQGIKRRNKTSNPGDFGQRLARIVLFSILVLGILRVCLGPMEIEEEEFQIVPPPGAPNSPIPSTPPGVPMQPPQQPSNEPEPKFQI